jgi:hypothetical protein
VQVVHLASPDDKVRPIQVLQDEPLYHPFGRDDVCGHCQKKFFEAGRAKNWRRGMEKRSHIRYFKTSPEIIRLTVMMYVQFPISLRNVEELLHERGVDISQETVRFWWNRFDPMFAADMGREWQ